MNTVNNLIQAVQLAAILVLGYARLDYGCRILQFYLQRKDGDLHRALAAYNGSTGSRVYSDKVLRGTGTGARNHLIGVASGKNPVIALSTS